MLRMLIATLLTMTAAASTASGQDGHVWGFVTTPQDARLFFGVPDSHEITLSLICEPKRSRLQIITTVLPPKAVAGRAMNVRLSNGASTLEYSGKVARERDGLSRGDLPNEYFRLLRTGSLLAIEVAGKTFALNARWMGNASRRDQDCKMSAYDSLATLIAIRRDSSAHG